MAPLIMQREAHKHINISAAIDFRAVQKIQRPMVTEDYNSHAGFFSVLFVPFFALGIIFGFCYLLANYIPFLLCHLLRDR